MKRLLVIFTLLFAFLVPQELHAAAPSQLLIINTATNTLAFYENGNLIKEFPVATGKSSTPTPQGKFLIVNKIKNRPYYTRNIPGGAPNNPLGDRWLGLNINGTPGNTYAIHGNSNESTVGKWITDGCIRMHNADIRWLFDRIQVQTTVLIKRAYASNEAIAASYGINLNQTAPASSTIAKGTGKTTANLNVRTGPSISAFRLTTLKAGTIVNIHETQNGWHRITAGNASGWVSGDYVAITSNSAPSTQKPAKTTANLNVRTGPSISAFRLTTLKAGTTVNIHETQNGWHRNTAGNVSGWVSGDYVR
ncbi:MAG: L,D-transpeptidase family protein [Ectobacillus sp.]